ncbi:protein of unknown function [Rhodovastum atsumiense]|nr:protein of unknown function [Rhodovastum atsumiense]
MAIEKELVGADLHGEMPRRERKRVPDMAFGRRLVIPGRAGRAQGLRGGSGKVTRIVARIGPWLRRQPSRSRVHPVMLARCGPGTKPTAGKPVKRGQFVAFASRNTVACPQEGHAYHRGEFPLQDIHGFCGKLCGELLDTAFATNVFKHMIELPEKTAIA